MVEIVDTTISVENLLQDRKKKLAFRSGLSDFERLMYFFELDNRPHLEAIRFNREAYEKLQWAGEGHFDVVNSFWYIYACSLIVCAKHRLYHFDTYNNMPCIGKGTGMKKETYATKYLGNSEFSSEALRRYADTTVLEMPKLKELAGLCHCVANYTPCPETPFNSTKGLHTAVRDFLPLMIDLIEKCCTEQSSISDEIELTIAENWKNWFINNQEKYCLEDYYNIYWEGSQPHIKGIPLFSTQNMNHPIPMNRDEVVECLDEMVNRIKIRAYRLYDKYGKTHVKTN